MSSGLSDAVLPLASPFATTHWSVVLCARQTGSPQGEAALEKLCTAYWPPLYAYVRRAGHTPEDSEDLTQSFFERLLTEGRIGIADRERGRFRTFLLSSLKYFLVNEWRRNSRLKRGAGSVHLSFNCSPEEALYSREPSTRESPDLLFERRWATLLLDQALSSVRKDYVRARQGPLYEALYPVMWSDPEAGTYRQIADSLGTTEGGIKVAVHRLRQRLRECIRYAVAATLSDPSDSAQVDAEIRHLQEVLRNQSPTVG